MRFTLPLLRRYVRGPHRPPDIEIHEETKKFSNLPEKYIKDVTNFIYYRTPRGINYRPKALKLFPSYVGMKRPWDLEAIEERGKEKRIPYIEPLRDWFFFRGDRVQVLFGKDAGKQGFVDSIIRERNWVIVHGLNTEVVSSKDEDGTIFAYTLEERPLLVPHQVALVDPGDLLPTEVEWSWTEAGEKVRVSKRSGRIIPFSRRIHETYAYKSRGTYAENEKDTVAADMEVTFKPRLMTFEMEVAEEMGIEENRTPKKTYWY